MKKTITLLIPMVMLGATLFAQSISPQVIGSAGVFTSAGGNSLSYTVGEPATTTLTAGSSIITQGFQQPNDVYTGLQSVVTPQLNAQLFPNPATTNINLVLTATNAGNYTVQLMDLLGRVVQQPVTKQIAVGESHFEFDVQNLPSSMYFIVVYSGSSSVASFKFTKIN